MDLDWMLLANHAETPPNGLLYVSGAGWDTVNVIEPLPPEAPAGIVAMVQGTLVVRLLFHPTEVGIEYPFRITIVDADGRHIGHVDGTVRAAPEDHQETPPTWARPATIIVGLSGLGLPNFGEYRISLQVNREHKGELPFRAMRRF